MYLYVYIDLVYMLFNSAVVNIVNMSQAPSQIPII